MSSTQALRQSPPLNALAKPIDKGHADNDLSKVAWTDLPKYMDHTGPFTQDVDETEENIFTTRFHVVSHENDIAVSRGHVETSSENSNGHEQPLSFHDIEMIDDVDEQEEESATIITRSQAIEGCNEAVTLPSPVLALAEITPSKSTYHSLSLPSFYNADRTKQVIGVTKKQPISLSTPPKEFEETKWLALSVADRKNIRSRLIQNHDREVARHFLLLTPAAQAEYKDVFPHLHDGLRHTNTPPSPVQFRQDWWDKATGKQKQRIRSFLETRMQDCLSGSILEDYADGFSDIFLRTRAVYQDQFKETENNMDLDEDNSRSGWLPSTKAHEQNAGEDQIGTEDESDNRNRKRRKSSKHARKRARH